MKRLQLREHKQYQTAAGIRLLDPVRHQFVPAGPEEQIRQSVLLSLHYEYGYPLGALLAEECVGRGTDDRGRADVLVVLPKRRQAACVQVLTPREKSGPTDGPAYSEHLVGFRNELGGMPGLSLIELPPRIDLSIDGNLVQCSPMGFDRSSLGNELVCGVDKALAARFGLPSLVRIRIQGYGMTTAEAKLARDIGVASCDWQDGANEKFAIQWERMFCEQMNCPFLIGLGPLSSNGHSGFGLLYRDEDHAFGVLARLELHASGLSRFAKEYQKSHPRVTIPPIEDVEVEILSETQAFAVIECKAPKINFTEAVLDQGCRYALRKKARFLILTNGSTFTRSYILRGKTPVHIDDLPAYNEAITGKYTVTRIAPEPDHIPLPDATLATSDALWLHTRVRDSIGCDTPPRLWRPLLALEDCLKSPGPAFTTPFMMYGVTFLCDQGCHRHEVGNPSGGKWPGAYRSFIVTEDASTQAMFGVSLLSKVKAVGNKAWGNTISTSVLIGALSFDAEFRPGIQCCMDASLVLKNNHVQVRHDGKITVGKGAVSRAKLLDFIRVHRPELVEGESVNLGTFPDASRLAWPDARDFICRFAAYTLLRNRFKESVRSHRASVSSVKPGAAS